MKSQNKILTLLLISRPIFVFLQLLPFILGFLYSKAQFSFIFLFQLILITLPYSFFLYGINDIYDYETDLKNERKKDIQGVKLKKQLHPYVKNISLAIVILLLISSLLTRNLFNISAMAVLIFISYFYSAPPLRLKTKPPLEELISAIGYVLIPFMLGFSFGSTFNNLPFQIYMIALVGAGVHALSTIVDFESDKKAKDNTLAVAFGKRTAAIFSVIGLAVAIIFGSFSSPIILANLYLILASSISLAIFPKAKLAHILIAILYLLFIVSVFALIIIKIF